MGWVKLQDEFMGMHRDSERNRLPSGKLWLAKNINFYPGKDGSLTPLGNVNQVASAVSSSISDPRWMGWLDYNNSGYAAKRIEVVVTNGGVVTLFADETSIGTWAYGKNIVYRNKLYVNQGDLRYYDGSSITTYSPPNDGNYWTIFLESMVNAGLTGALNRMEFSAPGDFSSWPTNGFWDMPAPILDVHGQREQILVWTSLGLHRLRGSIVPPGGNLVHSFIGPVEAPNGPPGQWKEWTIWAGKNDGIYMSDGNSIVDVTKRAGIKSYWQSLTKPSDPAYANPQISIWGDMAFVPYDGGHVTINLESMTASILVSDYEIVISDANYKGELFALKVNTGTDKFDVAQIQKAWTGQGSGSSAWFPSPSIETPIYLDGFEIKDFKNIGLAGKIKTNTDPGNDLYTQLGMDASYDTYADNQLTSSGTTAARRVYPLNKAGSGLGIKLDLLDNIADRIDSIWTDVNVREAGRSS